MQKSIIIALQFFWIFSNNILCVYMLRYLKLHKHDENINVSLNSLEQVGLFIARAGLDRHRETSIEVATHGARLVWRS